MDRNYDRKLRRARAREREREREKKREKIIIIIVQDKRFENCQEVSGIKVKGRSEKERGIGDNEVFQPGVGTPRGEGVTNPRRLRSCEPPANPARLDDTSNYVNSRCIEPSGTRCHFGKPPVFIRPRTWAPIFFFFFYPTLARLLIRRALWNHFVFVLNNAPFVLRSVFPLKFCLCRAFFFFPFFFPSNNTRY